MSFTFPKVETAARRPADAVTPPMDLEIYALLDSVPDTYWRYVARHELFSSLWQHHRQQRDNYRVLDVGCGSGGLLAYLDKHNTITPMGVDLFPGTLPYCLQRGINGVSVADATKLPFQADTFDLVIAQDVVEHVEDDTAALAEIYRVCTTGGLALILVPAFDFLWSARDVDLHHYRRYTLGQLTQQIQAVGFNAVHRTYTDLFLLPLLYAAIAIAPRRPDGLADLDTANPPGKSGIMNQALLAISRLEAAYAKYNMIPFGVSAVVLARKPAASTTL